MVWVVPMARAMFDRCEVVLDGGATLPEAPGRGAYRALASRGVLMVRRVVLSTRWSKWETGREQAGRVHWPARSPACSGKPCLVQTEGLVVRAGRRAEGHIGAVPGVDAHHAEGQRREFLLAELLAHLGIELVGDAGRRDLGQRLGPG